MSTVIDDGYILKEPLNTFYPKALKSMEEAFTEFHLAETIKQIMKIKAEYALHTAGHLHTNNLRPSIKELLAQKPDTAHQWEEIIYDVETGRYNDWEYSPTSHKDDGPLYEWKQKQQNRTAPWVCLYWSEIIQQYLLISNLHATPQGKTLHDEWLNNDTIEEYFYWNNTDIPDTTDEMEWQGRETVWEQAFDLNAPAQAGGLLLKPITHLNWVPIFLNKQYAHATTRPAFPEQHKTYQQQILNELTFPAATNTFTPTKEADKATIGKLRWETYTNNKQATQAAILPVIEEATNLEELLEALPKG